MIKSHSLYTPKFINKNLFMFNLNIVGGKIVKHFPSFFICTEETVKSINRVKYYRDILTVDNRIHGIFPGMKFHEDYLKLRYQLKVGFNLYTTTELHSRNVIEPTIPFPIYFSKLITYL